MHLTPRATRRAATRFLAAALVVLLPSAALAQAGELDASFGDGGTLATRLPGFAFRANDVAIQLDGRIVVVGEASDDTGSVFFVARYLVDGTLDTSFGADGIVLTRFAGEQIDLAWARSVVVQPDGRIVALGVALVGPGGNAHPVGALVRYNGDGTLDESFGGDGKVKTRAGGVSFFVGALALQDDGKLLIAGGLDSFKLARLNPDGSLDDTFGGDGRVRTRFGDPPTVRVDDVEILPDGRIRVLGDTGCPLIDGRVLMAGYNPDGSLDGSFSRDGRLVARLGSCIAGGELSLLPDGGVVVAVADVTEPSPRIEVVRYRSAGRLDRTFGDRGKVTRRFAPGYQPLYLSGLAVQDDGMILVAAADALVKTHPAFLLSRYRTDGTPDPTFGREGTVESSFLSRPGTLALQADGRIVAMGTLIDGGGNWNIGLARFLAA